MIAGKSITLALMRQEALHTGLSKCGPVRAHRVQRADPRQPHKIVTYVQFRVQGHITNAANAEHALKCWQERNKP